MNRNTLLLCFAAAMIVFSCKSVKAPQEGLVGEYLFKGNANDNSRYRNHGTVHGATLAKGHKGKKKSAYKFNGADHYLAIPTASQNNFDRKDDFSISFWVAVTPDQTDLSSGINDIIRKWRGDTQGYPFAIAFFNKTAPDSIRNRFTFVRYDGSICRHGPQVFSTVHTKDGFSHLVCIKQGAVMKLYLDKTLVSQTTDTTLPYDECGSHNNCEITVGMRGNKVRHFTGVVDDLRFYNRALSEAEIGLLNSL
jgi:hypothetical protein